MSKQFEPKYECGYCGRPYKNKNIFDKHVRMCEVLCKTPAERKRENEKIDNTPSITEIYELVKMLIIKNNQLENKIEKMSSWINTTKKKLNVVEWLNEHKTFTYTFRDWILKLVLNRDDMELIFKHNFGEGIRLIVQKYFTQSDETIPIKSFEQKDNVIYVFTSTETGWEIINPEQFILIFNTLTKGLINQLKLWQDENRHRICSSGFTEIYSANVKKITGGDLSLEQQHVKVRRALYTSLKINIRNIIQYDLEF